MVSTINPRNNQAKGLNNPSSAQTSRESRNRHNISVFPLLRFFKYPLKKTTTSFFHYRFLRINTYNVSVTVIKVL